MTKTNNGGVRASSNRNEVTLGVMGEKIANIDGRIMDIRKDIETLSNKIDDKYITRNEFEDTVREVDALRDNVKWIVRLVIGSVITAIIGVLLVSNKLI